MPSTVFLKAPVSTATRTRVARVHAGKRAALLTLLLVAGLPAGVVSSTVALAAPDPTPPALPVEGLVDQQVRGLDLVKVRPGTDLAAYKSVFIEPIELSVRRRHDEIILQPRDAEHARTELLERLRREFGEQLAPEPGPGVVRLSILITEFVPNYQPIAERKDGLGGVGAKSYSVGRAAFQAVLRDGSTGAVVAVMKDDDTGPSFESNLNLRTLYGDADRIFDRWARQLAGLFPGKPGGARTG